MHHRNFNLLSWVMIAGLSLGGVLAQQVPAQQVPDILISYPETILYNGKVITVDDRLSRVQALAIRDGKFLMVGSNSEVLKLAGPQTRQIDLQGKSVIPGLIDTHLHQVHLEESKKPRMGGVRLSLSLKDKESGMQELKKIVELFEPGEWVGVKGSRNKVYYTLTRHDLDSVTPQNPVFIVNSSQEVVANSLALKMARLPEDTPGLMRDPETGEPTGLLTRWAAGIITYEHTPWPDIEEVIPRQIAELKKYNSVGLTTIAAKVAGLAFSVYKEIWKQGELTIRLRLAHEFLRQNPNAEAYLKRLGSFDDFGDELLKIVGATVHPVDGASGDGASLTFEPQIRQRPTDPFGSYGEIKWSKGEDWDEADKTRTEAYNIILANRYGWSVTSMHSQGDRGSNILLQTYLQAHREKSIKGRRFGIDHGLMQTPENIQLMKDLEVIPSVAAKYLFIGTPDNLIYRYGADRVYGMTPVRTLIQAGLKPAAEADVSIPYGAPLWNLEKFVTRADESGRVWNSSESVDRMTALTMYTKWAARYSGDEDIIGSIEVGKLADLVVLDGDFDAVPDDQISELPIVYTLMGGKFVFDRAVDPVAAPPASTGE